MAQTNLEQSLSDPKQSLMTGRFGDIWLREWVDPSVPRRDCVHLPQQEAGPSPAGSRVAVADRPTFFAALKRRNVLRAGVLYAGAAWALSQGIAQLGPLFNAPSWAVRGFVIVCVIGVPFWIAFAWFYEFTPQSFVWNHIAAAELGLGQTQAAFAAIAHSQSVASRSGDRFFIPGIAVSNAHLYAEVGRADLAVPLLVETFTTGRPWAYSSPALLWLDPSWNPIRRGPRFQALLKKYAKYQPAAANAIAPSAFHPATPVPAGTNGAAHG